MVKECHILLSLTWSLSQFAKHPRVILKMLVQDSEIMELPVHLVKVPQPRHFLTLSDGLARLTLGMEMSGNQFLNEPYNGSMHG